MLLRIQKRDLLIPLLVLAIIILASFFYFFWQNRTQTPTVTKELEQKIQTLPSLPSEPSIVMGYSGQIKSIDQKKNSFKLVTVWGEKTIQFDSSVTVNEIHSKTSTATPPPMNLTTENTFQDKKLLSTDDLQEGDIVQVSSLTNVRGISMFKASSIIIINSSL